MYLITILAFGCILGAAAADCNHNNCLRAVLASAFPTRNGAADCSSYLMATVTPATVTVKATDTFTTATTTTKDVLGPVRRRGNRSQNARVPEPVLEVRQMTVSPTAIPAYASACSGSIGYSSACSCIGVIPTTQTVAAPSTTVTVATVTSTQVSTTTANPSFEFNVYSDSACHDSISNNVLTNGECISYSGSIYAIFVPSNMDSCTCNIDIFSDSSCQSLSFSDPFSDFELGCLPSDTSGSLKLDCSSC